MKDSDNEFLTRIFAEDDAPLAELPPGLNAKLYAIPSRAKRRRIMGLSALAASLLFVVVGVGVYQQHYRAGQYSEGQRQAALAREELMVTLHYLQLANDKANSSLNKTLNHSLQSATLKPVIESIPRVSAHEGV